MASGRSFYYLKGAGALLELALVQYTMSRLVAKARRTAYISLYHSAHLLFVRSQQGFTAIIPPDIVREGVAEGCGFQPRGKETQVTNHAGAYSCPLVRAHVPDAI